MRCLATTVSAEASWEQDIAGLGLKLDDVCGLGVSVTTPSRVHAVTDVLQVLIHAQYMLMSK